MSTKRFPSKIDAWLAILLVAALLTQTVAMIAVLYTSGDTTANLVMIVTTVMLFVLIGSTLKMTYYIVDGPTLRVVSGPFRWNIPLADIHSIEETRSPWSSPALSLDRLRIVWGQNKKIMISPNNKAAFAKAIGVEITRRNSG